MSGLVGTSSSRSTIVGRHLDTARFWARFNGNTPVLQESFNCSDLSRSQAGIYVLTFIDPMPTTNYCVIAFSSQSQTLCGTTNTTNVTIECRNASNSAVNTDKISVVIFV